MFNLIIVPDSVFERLREYANKRGISINTLVAEIISDWITKNEIDNLEKLSNEIDTTSITNINNNISISNYTENRGYGYEQTENKTNKTSFGNKVYRFKVR